MEKKLEVKNLTISFRTPAGKVHAVRGIDFDLYKGETLAIVGESGSGKSVTNRAVIGILANNAIVESGEIIYDGKDLLKISEEEFHKIRGDKIAMIFQDPMSSLNPIMRVGKQLTEAMLLKGKAGQKNARRLFNKTLGTLKKHMDEVAETDEERKKNDEACKTFDSFCIVGSKLERKYNACLRAAQELKSDIDEQLFLISKNRAVDYGRLSRVIELRVKEAYHPDVLVSSDEFKALLADVLSGCKAAAKIKVKEKRANGENAGSVSAELTEKLEKLSAILDEAETKTKPNYFTLGYYMLRNPESDVEKTMDVDELAKMTRKYVDEEFMLDFIARAGKAVEYARKVSLEKKKLLIAELEKAEAFFAEGNLTGERKVLAEKTIKELENKVKDAINELEIVKDSKEYTFSSSVRVELERYFSGAKNNPKEEKRFKVQTAKREKLVKAGKEPDWKVVPPALVDLDAATSQICDILRELREDYKTRLEKTAFSPDEATVEIIDYLKEQASTFVYKVTKKLAKARALKLMEEVGIPEPAVRYKQYPFEFSGGMRQRIVIAIALAADPDVLICDEPTTALDVSVQSQILELINKLKRERKLSVIFITHDLGVVANIADRIAVMYAGKIVEYGTADDVFYDPHHPYTWALLSSMPDLDTDGKLDAIPGTPPNMIYPPKGDAFAPRNKYAMQIDFEAQPPMFDVSPTHKAATWLLHPDAPRVSLPEQVLKRIERMKKQGGDAL